MKDIRNRVADIIRPKNTLDELMQEALQRTEHIKDIISAKEHPAIKKLISHFEKSVDDLQRQQNKLSEYPERYADEIRSLNALRKVTESFVSFFDIPKQVKKEAFEREEYLHQKQKEAELHKRQNDRF